MFPGGEEAEEEVNCLEEYFKLRHFPCTVTKDPTSDDIFSVISAAQDEADISCLMVFVLSHEKKGLVQVEGTPCDLPVSDIITHMCIRMECKPKVSLGDLEIKC